MNSLNYVTAGFVALYASLLLIGGLFAYWRKESKASIISASILFILLVAGAIMTCFDWTAQVGLLFCIIISMVVGVWFSYKYYSTQALVPAVPVLALSFVIFLLALIALIFTFF
eukprot:TRINITY_DN7193_c0_g1_i1.p1 TRINITY_DN7193_c0_g1~~TRINITY_DN7193_c0_g1_i1.p1  ORF type:complete len:114 (-),score=33.21 TRINITY_DN7193_c0_g1_i1:109-450(-)